MSHHLFNTFQIADLRTIGTRAVAISRLNISRLNNCLRTQFRILEPGNYKFFVVITNDKKRRKKRTSIDVDFQTSRGITKDNP